MQPALGQRGRRGVDRHSPHVGDEHLVGALADDDLHHRVAGDGLAGRRLGADDLTGRDGVAVRLALLRHEPLRGDWPRPLRRRSCGRRSRRCAARDPPRRSASPRSRAAPCPPGTVAMTPSFGIVSSYVRSTVADELRLLERGTGIGDVRAHDHRQLHRLRALGHDEPHRVAPAEEEPGLGDWLAIVPAGSSALRESYETSRPGWLARFWACVLGHALEVGHGDGGAGAGRVRAKTAPATARTSTMPRISGPMLRRSVQVGRGGARPATGCGPGAGVLVEDHLVAVGDDVRRVRVVDRLAESRERERSGRRQHADRRRRARARHRRRVGIALVGIGLAGAFDHRTERAHARRARPTARSRTHRQRAERRLGDERHRAGHRLDEHEPERVQVGAAVEACARCPAPARRSGRCRAPRRPARSSSPRPAPGPDRSRRPGRCRARRRGGWPASRPGGRARGRGRTRARRRPGARRGRPATGSAGRRRRASPAGTRRRGAPGP